MAPRWKMRRSGVIVFSALSALAVLVAPLESGAAVPTAVPTMGHGTPWLWPRSLAQLGQGLRLRGGMNTFVNDVNMNMQNKPPVEIGADLTENGGVLKTVLETGWKTPRFSIGDEVALCMHKSMSLEYAPLPHARNPTTQNRPQPPENLFGTNPPALLGGKAWAHHVGEPG